MVGQQKHRICATRLKCDVEEFLAGVVIARQQGGDISRTDVNTVAIEDEYGAKAIRANVYDPAARC
jgi:hypothetical protein